MKKVVFVDDSATMLMLASRAVNELVQANKIELVQYKNPLSLLEDVEMGVVVYDLLITDINMPFLNGFELVKKLKELDWLDNALYMALTTEGSAGKVELIKEIGFKGWISKPFKPETLKKAVEKVLEL